MIEIMNKTLLEETQFSQFVVVKFLQDLHVAIVQTDSLIPEPSPVVFLLFCYPALFLIQERCENGLANFFKSR